MRDINIHDRYAQTPGDSWIGRPWQSTRKAACGCYLTGVVVSTRPGAVKIKWVQCGHWPDSWEATERGTLMKA